MLPRLSRGLPDASPDEEEAEKAAEQRPPDTSVQHPREDSDVIDFTDFSSDSTASSMPGLLDAASTGGVTTDTEAGTDQDKCDKCQIMLAPHKISTGADTCTFHGKKVTVIPVNATLIAGNMSSFGRKRALLPEGTCLVKNSEGSGTTSVNLRMLLDCALFGPALATEATTMDLQEEGKGFHSNPLAKLEALILPGQTAEVKAQRLCWRSQLQDLDTISASRLS